MGRINEGDSPQQVIGEVRRLLGELEGMVPPDGIPLEDEVLKRALEWAQITPNYPGYMLDVMNWLNRAGAKTWQNAKGRWLVDRDAGLQDLASVENGNCDKCDGPGGKRTVQNQVCMPLNGRVEAIDPCIHHIVAALNAGGIRTIASCCAHGKLLGRIDLVDGRVLVFHQSPDGIEWEAPAV